MGLGEAGRPVGRIMLVMGQIMPIAEKYENVADSFANDEVSMTFSITFSLIVLEIVESFFYSSRDEIPVLRSI